MTIADTLREARRRIEEPEKWGKGPNLRYRECAMIAIDQAAAFESFTGDPFALFRLALGNFNISIISWNDAPERTHAEVMAAFDRAIILAEKEEEKT